ncbi:MAG: hypothetical protein Q8S55_20265 [Methylococcaceae bacterium]|nr:hypothetical protein [Methylococcaceae bacterium]
MKCHYYLTSTLDSTQSITDDLHQAGIEDWFIHVLSKDAAGLKKHKIHSSNFLEQLDILRFGIIGAIAGLLIGFLSAVLLDRFQLFGTNLPNSAYFGLIMFWTLFCAWEGGLTGIATENKKIVLFHDDLDAGSYLLLVYSKQADEAPIKTLMAARHPEAQLTAVDTHFYNPLATLTRINV